MTGISLSTETINNELIIFGGQKTPADRGNLSAELFFTIFSKTGSNLAARNSIVFGYR